MKRRQFVRSLGVGAASLAVPGILEKRLGAALTSRPNILFIMTDDHAAHAMSCYGSRLNRTPNLDRIARGGVRFTNCFCTNGICAPNRAVILTGKYSHLNGVRDNVQEFDGSQQTFPKLLQAAGYQTLLIGKWHLKSDPTGFDYWNILPGQGEYYNPDLVEMGERKRHQGYVTDIITDISLDSLDRKRDKTRPFLLMLHHKAPHRNWQPALRHLHLYDGTVFPEPGTLFDDYSTRSDAARQQEMTVGAHMTLESDLKLGPPPDRMTEEQKKTWEAAYGPKREKFNREKPEGKDLVRWKYQRYMQDYLACVAAVDESTGRVLDYLDKSGLAANTLVVYTSDQGFYLGDHGWFDKRFMYEESLRMPLLMRLPGMTKSGSTNAELVSDLDFAPTFLDLAGIRKPAGMQGEPFTRLIEGRKIKGWRESVYYHYYEYPAVHMAKKHYGLRTKKHKLIHFYYDIDAWEMYDLEKDPLELRNVYDDPAYAKSRAELTAELRRLQKYYGDSDELAKKFIEEDVKGPDRIEDRFPGYKPKTTPDTVFDFRPQLAASLSALPPEAPEGLPGLLKELARFDKLAKERPGEWKDGNIALGADPKEYIPSDEELVASELGDRIARVVASAEAADIERVLGSAGIKDREVSYGKILFRHSDVMGSGRFFYASVPLQTIVALRK